MNAPLRHPPAVTADLRYLRPMAARPYHYMYAPPAGVARQNGTYDVRAMRIADGRGRETSLEREGYRLLDAPSAVADFRDEDAVRAVYYREAAELVLGLTGARYARVFDHQLRVREVGRPALTFGRDGGGPLPGAAGNVHNDYTERSGREKLAAVLQNADMARRVRRHALLNVWRSIKGPIVDTPLAVCDARSVAAEDLVAADIHYPSRSGEIYLLQHSPRHAWAYFPGMDRDEALVFKQYDSRRDVARFVPHGAFDLPGVPPDAPLRESIELRLLVVYDE